MKYIYKGLAIIVGFIGLPFGLIAAIAMGCGDYLVNKAFKAEKVTKYPDGSYTVGKDPYVYNKPVPVFEPKKPRWKLIYPYKDHEDIP